MIPGGWADTSARSASLSYATAMASSMRFNSSSRMPAALSRARAACARHFSTFRLRGMAQSWPWPGVTGNQFLACSGGRRMPALFTRMPGRSRRPRCSTRPSRMSCQSCASRAAVAALRSCRSPGSLSGRSPRIGHHRGKNAKMSAGCVSKTWLRGGLWLSGRFAGD